MEEGSGSLTPISSTASTAVDHQHINDLLPSPQKSPFAPPVEQPPPSGGASLAVPHRNSTRRRSFSSAQKLPVLEPSTSPFRRQFDFLLLWILQTVTWWYISVVAIKHRVVNFVWAVWYDWHAWSWWGRYMIVRDVARIRKLPRHVAVILDQRKTRRSYDADETIRRAVEVTTWCASAGISIVTIYEPTGLLKKDIKTIQRSMQKVAATYFHKAPPKVDVRTPQSALLTNGSLDDDRDMEVLVISLEDSRVPIVDLARTLGDMTKQEKLFPEDISIDLIHENLTESLMTEPDLLILFAPRVDLQGFPPWQIRLTEIFHLPDNTNFGYSVFLRGLQTYDRAEMRLGR